ncbi:hypothetical protein ACLOJK_034262 [Asimina triloba]
MANAREGSPYPKTADGLQSLLSPITRAHCLDRMTLVVGHCFCTARTRFGFLARWWCCHDAAGRAIRGCLLAIACRWVLMLGLDRTVAGFLLWMDDGSLAFDAVEMLLKDFTAANRYFRPWAIALL